MPKHQSQPLPVGLPIAVTRVKDDTAYIYTGTVELDDAECGPFDVLMAVESCFAYRPGYPERGRHLPMVGGLLALRAECSIMMGDTQHG